MTVTSDLATAAAVAAGLTRLRASVPDTVREVCQVLSDAGYQAVCVGGAVRDALLGQAPDDWDLASSALPEAVLALFPRTIATGLQHGTVTVLVGRGAQRIPIEVTTYRGDGEYLDARRPSAVVLGVPLHEDLARRDLVVNAIAYDPIADVLIDPFDGVGDLAARRLRAVGDPVARFTEDGLRVMRAVRFAATLQFELEPATEAAIAVALPSLARVSRERVHDELGKLLGAPVPSRGLQPAWRTGIIGSILPELAAQDAGGQARRDAAIDRAREAPLAVKLAALLWGHPPAVVDAALRRLTFANAVRERAVKLVATGALLAAGSTDEPAIRRVLAAVGRPGGADAVALWRALEATALADTAAAILERGDALASGDLALSGGQLIDALGLARGPAVGKLVAALLDAVLDDPALNTTDALLAHARSRA